MDNELAYSTIKPRTRDELVLLVKNLALHSGFRTIIPFADRKNSSRIGTLFTCCMGGLSTPNKQSTGCPFKVFYSKQIGQEFYTMDA